MSKAGLTQITLYIFKPSYREMSACRDFSLPSPMQTSPSQKQNCRRAGANFRQRSQNQGEQTIEFYLLQHKGTCQAPPSSAGLHCHAVARRLPTPLCKARWEEVSAVLVNALSPRMITTIYYTPPPTYKEIPTHARTHKLACTPKTLSREKNKSTWGIFHTASSMAANIPSSS